MIRNSKSKELKNRKQEKVKHDNHLAKNGIQRYKLCIKTQQTPLNHAV